MVNFVKTGWYHCKELMLNIWNVTVAELRKNDVDNLEIDKTIDLRQGDEYPLKTLNTKLTRLLCIGNFLVHQDGCYQGVSTSRTYFDYYNKYA